MKKNAIILLFFLASAIVKVEAAEQFPFLAVITDDKVNIRAGQAVSFEAMGQADKGSDIVVVGKEFGWYKVKLPVTLTCFISGKYVRTHPGDIGEILGSKVNVRARPGENFTVLGKLPRGTLVRIRNKSSEWYEIEPLEGIYGWVSEGFVKFKSQDVPPVKNLQIVTRNIYAKKKAIDAEVAAVKEEQVAAKTVSVAEKKKELFTVTGRIVQVDENDLCQEFRYKLVTSDVVRYFLRARNIF